MDASDLRGPTATSTEVYDKWYKGYIKDLNAGKFNVNKEAKNTALEQGWTAAQQDVDIWYARLQAIIKTGATGWPTKYFNPFPTPGPTPPLGTKLFTKAEVEFNLNVAKKVRDKAWDALEKSPETFDRQDQRLQNIASTKVVTTSPRTPTKYNVPSVREAYHASSAAFLESYEDDGINAPAQVKQALDLWTTYAKNGNSKGMIQSLNWLPSNVAEQVLPKALYGGRPLYGIQGFQFLYNPNRIDMSFNGVQGIDVASALQDSQNFNLLGTSDAPSTVSFSILINRMLDMKYLSTQGMRDQFKIENVYGNNFKVNNVDLTQIYQKGTMYDVEFLLGTLTGFQMPNPITGRFSTDVGFIGARPVELHLGPNLRYIVRIDSFSLSHKAFNRRMVPIYTELELNCGRLPWGYNKSTTTLPGSVS